MLHAQIDLQNASNALPPGHLTRLYVALNTAEFDWLAKDLRQIAPYWKYMTAPTRRRAARHPQLVARPLDGQVQFYETPGFPAKAKRLYILFTGQKGQLFIPISMFLYLLPPGPKDVLVVGVNNGQYKAGGVEGLGATIKEIGDTLKSRYSSDAYRHVTVSGCSVGCSISMQTAEILKADLCVLLAARLPLPFKNMAVNSGPGFAAYDHFCDCNGSKVKRTISVFASGFEHDVQTSAKLKHLRPQLIEYHLIIPKDHNVLAWLNRTRTIGMFFLVIYSEKGSVLGMVAPVFAVIGLRIRAFRQKMGWQTRVIRLPRYGSAWSAKDRSKN